MPARRPTGAFPKLAGKPWNMVSEGLQKFLEQVFLEQSGLPSGYYSDDPTTIEAGDAADPGEETDGWASGSHTHAVSTASAGELGNTNSEGVATTLARSDHGHKRTVRVSKAGTDVGTRNRLNLIEGANITLTMADDAGNDEVDVTVAVTGAPVGSWTRHFMTMGA